MSDTIIIDQPEQLSYLQFVSVIQGLGLELQTGMRYGRVSALKVAQAKGWTSVTGNATRKNLTVCLAELLHEQPSSPVMDHGREILQEVLDAEGWAITLS